MSAVIASELGLDPKLARRCGFFHDIGKAVDHEVEGSHASIGARICKGRARAEHTYGTMAQTLREIGDREKQIYKNLLGAIKA